MRSEADVWPLFYLHILAATGGLAAGGQARAWKLTPAGEAFVNSSGPMQIGIALSIWWYLVDWRIAYPVEGLSRGLPPDFRETVRAHLLELKTGKMVSYEQFADDLIVRTGLTWPSVDQTFVQDTLRFVIERLVIHPLEGFGCVECEYRMKSSSGIKSKELVESRLTPFGKGLLETL